MKTISAEVEFYLNCISTELKIEKKPTFYFFSDFSKFPLALSEPWAGGFYCNNAIFLPMKLNNPRGLGKPLAHEITHYLLEAKYGFLPLWLNEGLAESLGWRAYIKYMKRNEYKVYREKTFVSENNYIKDIRSLKTYPVNHELFYQQSQLMVEFLLKDKSIDEIVKNNDVDFNDFFKYISIP